MITFTPCVATSFVPRNAARFNSGSAQGSNRRIEVVHDEQLRFRNPRARRRR